jgi:DNA-binding HxlR family transcriptional regulator
VRSYRQFCALARALDVIGDRWTLLIVRELLARPRRYRELLDGLPGIATNLLAERLRHLEAEGVVERSDGDGARYRLTGWGQGLAGVVYAIGQWAIPLMDEPSDDDEYRSHWFAIPLQGLLQGVDPSRPSMTVAIDIGDEPLTLTSAGGQVVVRPGPPPSAVDLTVTGPPWEVVKLFAGALDDAGATAAGITVTGPGGHARLAQLRTPAAATSATGRG